MGSKINFIFTTNSAFWFEKDLTNDIRDIKINLPVNINFNSNNKTIEWIKKQNKNWLTNENEIDAALKYGHLWPYICVDDRIVGYIKIGFDKVFINDFDKLINFPKKMAFIYDTYVVEEMRGKGIATYLICEAIKYIKNQGYTKVGCHIPPWNKPSIHAYEKIGFKKINYIRNYRILGVPIKIVKTPNNFSFFKGGKFLKEELPYA